MIRHLRAMKPRYWLLCAILASAPGCDVVTDPGPVPGALTVLGGDAQADTVGATLSVPLGVEVLDEDGEALPDAAVDWVVVAGEATVTPASSETDEAGRLTATVRLGTVAGPVRVEARVGGLPPVSFGLTALPGRAAVVEPSMESVALDALGDSARLEAEVFDRHGNPIPDAELTRTTSDSTVAALGSNGTVRSVGPGTATVTLRSESATAAVPVTVQQAPESVTVTPGGVRLTALEATTPLTAAAFDRNGFVIEGIQFDWTSGDPGVATVSGSGVVTARGPGEARITATVDGVAATATARVEQEVAAVVVEAPADTLREPGETVQAQATARDANGFEIPGVTFAWSSHRTSVATVNATGLVTAGSGRGEARITARAGGVEGRTTVTRIPFGVLVLTFDDAFQDAYTRVFPLLEKHGIVANIALPTGFVGRPGRLTEAQVREIHDAGWSILPHSVDHPDLTRLTNAQVDHQLRESREWVRDRNFRGSEIFVVPFHRWNSSEQEAVRRHFIAARGWGIDHSRHGGMVDWPATDPYALTSIPADGLFVTEKGRQQMADWWAEAVSQGRFLGTFFHSIGAEDLAAFEDVIERMARHRAHIKTYSDLFE